MTPGSGVVVDVHAAGVSFPELLQTRGEYQVKPPLPFVPGSEVGGVVRSRARRRAVVSPGDRVAAFCMLGGFAEVAVAPAYFCFPLPEELDFAQGAALVLNYHTAYFALKLRGRLAGVRPCSCTAPPVASEPLRCRSRAGSAHGRSRSSRATRRSASRARPAPTRSCAPTAPWKDQAKEFSGGGVDVVLDPVGGDRFTDSLRSLREGGRVVVVGFTGGSIPEVRVNRLLLGNTEVVGAGWGAYVMSKPERRLERSGAAISELIA